MKRATEKFLEYRFSEVKQPATKGIEKYLDSRGILNAIISPLLVPAIMIAGLIADVAHERISHEFYKH